MKTIHTTHVFDHWLEMLKDTQGKARIYARLRRIELGNFGDVKPIGQGVSEMRIDYGPGYRVYFSQKGMEIVILLADGDKSTQANDIKIALKLAQQMKEE